MVRKFGVLISLVLIVTGILCIIYKTQIANILAVVAGAVVLVIGGSYAFFAWLTKNNDSTYIWKVILGILLGICGLYMIFNSHLTINIVGIFIGIIACIAGIDRFRMSYIRIKGGENYLASIIMGVIHVLFGIGMCLIPSYGVAMMVLLMGIYIVSAGIMVLMSAVKFKDL